jgi:hypothetical protein
MVFTSSDTNIVKKLRKAMPNYPHSVKEMFPEVTNEFHPNERVHLIISYVKRKGTKVDFNVTVKDSRDNVVLRRGTKDRKKLASDAISTLQLPLCATNGHPGHYIAQLTIKESNGVAKKIDYPFIIS